MSDAAAQPQINLLLDSLPPQERRHLLRLSETVDLRANEEVYGVGEPIKHVYFPTRGCLISLVKVLSDGKKFDTVPLGYEGLVGVEALLGIQSQFAATVRVGGQALRIKAKALKAELRDSGKWSDVLLRYLKFLLGYASQKSGCNRFHSLERHFCSWLLTLHDRVGADELEITHEIFARMLGVRRVGITQAARKLQHMGLIRYSWGRLSILDRQRLEDHACVCHSQQTQAYQRLLDDAWPYRFSDGVGDAGGTDGTGGTP